MPSFVGFISFVLLLRLDIVSANDVDDEICDSSVIKQCAKHASDLFTIVEKGNTVLLNKKCEGLQAMIDCLSTPRCPGDLMTSFRMLTMVTATSLSKVSNLCPYLKLQNLEAYVKGQPMPCPENAFFRDECDRVCRCQDGNLNPCFRLRKEFTFMSVTERERFISVVKFASADPRYKSEYGRLTTLHSRIPSPFLHHMPQVFLPWHRWFVLEFENYLRKIDCRVTIPYWDWSKDSEHWTRGSERRDAWNPGLHGLGGNGVLPNRCVADGPFGQGHFSVPLSVGGGCVKRDFNISCNLPNKKDAERLVSLNNFTEFEQTIRERFHTIFHDCVGGLMSHHKTASFAPEFWLLHSFVDKLWADWQMRGNQFKFQYYTSIGFQMPGSPRFPWELLDVNALPGDVKVMYDFPKNTAH